MSSLSAGVTAAQLDGRLLTAGDTMDGALTHTVPQVRSFAAGITASVTQTQGQQPLTAAVNEISVCANVGDVVTLPPAAAGLTIRIANNGAQNATVFPALGDDAGAGVDVGIVLNALGRTILTAYDSTNWENM